MKKKAKKIVRKVKKASPKPKARRQTTALVRRPSVQPRAGIPSTGQPAPLMQAAPQEVAKTLGNHALENAIFYGDLGLVEVEFSEKEIASLSKPIDLNDLRVKPTGQVYAAHPIYTRRLNEAFGFGRWTLRPVGMPQIGNNTVVVPYLLMVHGKPVAQAMGEQEYFPNNKQQTYGDALESTHASGLRRVCKHLGIGLELWDRAFNDQYLDEFCVRVKCKTSRKGEDEKFDYYYRRKVDPRFWNEVKSGPRQMSDDEDERGPSPTIRPVASDPHADEPITDQQRTRLFAIARRRGRDDAELKTYLWDTFQITSSKQLKRRHYETCCAAIEHPGPLPAKPVRQPGEEG